jgi:hypothetical protein
MRAVLVERVVPEWDIVGDISFQRLEDLVRSLGSPEPMVPREYRETGRRKRGRKWLERAWEIDAALPEASPEIFAVALAAVGLGIGGLKLPEKARQSLDAVGARSLPASFAGGQANRVRC